MGELLKETRKSGERQGWREAAKENVGCPDINKALQPRPHARAILAIPEAGGRSREGVRGLADPMTMPSTESIINRASRQSVLEMPPPVEDGRARGRSPLSAVSRAPPVSRAPRSPSRWSACRPLSRRSGACCCRRASPPVRAFRARGVALVLFAGRSTKQPYGKAECPAFLAIALYRNLAYSALACFRMGMSGSASFQRARKSIASDFEQTGGFLRAIISAGATVPLSRIHRILNRVCLSQSG